VKANSQAQRPLRRLGTKDQKQQLAQEANEAETESLGCEQSLVTLLSIESNQFPLQAEGFSPQRGDRVPVRDLVPAWRERIQCFASKMLTWNERGGGAQKCPGVSVIGCRGIFTRQ